LQRSGETFVAAAKAKQDPWANVSPELKFVDQYTAACYPTFVCIKQSIKRRIFILAVVLSAAVTGAIASGDMSAYLRAYPERISEDTCFESVVGSQPFPPLKYAAPVIGWKNHPDSIRVVQTGALVFPQQNDGTRLYLTPMTSLGPDGKPAVFNPDQIIQKLIDGYMPGVQSFWTKDGLHTSQTVFCSMLDSNTLAAVCRFTLTNQSGQANQASLWLDFGLAKAGHNMNQLPQPYSKELALDSSFIVEPEGNILACIITKGLDASLYSQQERKQLRINVNLSARESKSIDLVIPCSPQPQNKRETLRRVKVDERLGLFRRFWRYELDRNTQFIVPEKRIQDSYRAIIASNLILMHGSKSNPAVTARAMDRLGYYEESKQLLARILPEHDNHLSLWAATQHYLLTKNQNWLRKAAPDIVKSAEWIAKERAKTKTLENDIKPAHYGLIPESSPFDGSRKDYWYWTDAFCYAGLMSAADVLSEIGLDADSARLAHEAEDYRKCILESVEHSINTNCTPPFLPPGPYMSETPSADYMVATGYPVLSPVCLVEAGILDAKDQKVHYANYWTEKFGLCSGLCALEEIHPHYIYNQALSQLLRGETDKFVWTFYSLFAYGQSRTTYTTASRNNIITGYTGSAWDESQPDTYSNSRVLDMLRIALLVEDGSTLHLLPGTPRRWLSDGKQIEIKKAPTYFGEVNLTAVSSVKSGDVRITIDPPVKETAEIILHVRPPVRYGYIREVTVNGKPWKDFKKQSVNLGKISGKTEVICSF